MEHTQFRLNVTKYTDDRIKVQLEQGTRILFELYAPTPDNLEDVKIIKTLLQRQTSVVLDSMFD